jgi:hypothetical protein
MSKFKVEDFAEVAKYLYAALNIITSLDLHVSLICIGTACLGALIALTETPLDDWVLWWTTLGLAGPMAAANHPRAPDLIPWLWAVVCMYRDGIIIIRPEHLAIPLVCLFIGCCVHATSSEFDDFLVWWVFLGWCVSHKVRILNKILGH